jgi:hypothetical protein
MIIPITVSTEGLIEAQQAMERTDFASLGVKEARIEEFLRKEIGRIFDDEDETLLIVGQQVVNARNARNDLVALDGSGSLVLIEIKRDSSDMVTRPEALEFQAVRYAGSLATIRSVDDLVERIFARYINKWSREFELSDLTPEERGKRMVNRFLRQNDAEKSFNRHQRIILVASAFDDQTLSAAAWMNDNGIDIACISLNPLKAGESLYLVVEKLIPAHRNEEFLVGFPVGFPDTSTDREQARVTGTEKSRTRTILPKMRELMEWGLVKPGDVLKVKNYPDSDAVVEDSKTVRFKNRVLSYNEWGCEVTGWSSINIYDWALAPNGRTLTDLRAERMDMDKQENAAALAGVDPAAQRVDPST